MYPHSHCDPFWLCVPAIATMVSMDYHDSFLTLPALWSLLCGKAAWSCSWVDGGLITDVAFMEFPPNFSSSSSEQNSNSFFKKANRKPLL